jgi:hypothetical protein
MCAFLNPNFETLKIQQMVVHVAIYEKARTDGGKDLMVAGKQYAALFLVYHLLSL